MSSSPQSIPPQPDGVDSAAPILVAFAGPAQQKRVTVLFRVILIIPQVFVLIFIGLAALLAVVVSWFCALVLGRLPSFAAEFLPGVLRWQTRVLAYWFLLTDQYPPFSFEYHDTYPVLLTARPGRLNRLAVLFRLFIGLPAWIVSYVAVAGIGFPTAFVVWLIVLIGGRMPPTLYRAIAAILRYQVRVSGYEVMITSEWPWGLFGDADLLEAQGSHDAYGGYGSSTSYAAPGTYPPPGTYAAPGTYAPAGTYPPAGAPAMAGATYGVVPGSPESTGQPPTADQPGPGQPAAGHRPTLPGVDFTFGGPSYLWGYTADRSHCGIWSATDLSAPPQTWPVGEQGEAWTRFWQLEPQAVEFSEQEQPPPAVGYPTASSSYAAPPSYPSAPSSAWAPAYPAASPYGSAPPYQAMTGQEPAVPVAPAYGGSDSPTDDPRWRLVLPQGSKVLLVLFLILGVPYSIYNVNRFRHSHSLRSLEADIQVQAAYSTLNSAVIAYENDTNSCRTSTQVLQCVTGTDRTVGQAFGTFATQLKGISVPSGAVAAADALEADSTHAQQIFEQLSTATNATQYAQNVQNANIDGVLTQFSTDYQHLVNVLG